MSKKLSLLMAMLMLLSVVCVPVSFAAEDVSAVSITQNQCFYVGTDRVAAPLTVKGIKEDETEIDLTGAEGVTYASSDESVFRFDGNQLSSTGKNGKAVITVTYGGKTASMVMIRQNATTPEGKNVITVPNGGTTYNTTDFQGHADGDSYTGMTVNWHLRLAQLSSSTKKEDGTLTPREDSDRWFESGYRSMAGWFYDDGESAHTPGLVSMLFSDSVLFHENFEADYGYGEFAEKWEGMKSWSGLNSAQISANSGGKYVNGESFGNSLWGFQVRSKGWHQVVVSLEKNPTAEYGWSIYTYMDGILYGTKDIVPTSSEWTENWGNYWDKLASMEMRTNVGGTYYYDDFLMAGSLEQSYALTGEIGEKGSVQVNGAAFADGDQINLHQGDAIRIAVSPEKDYEIDTVKLGDTLLTGSDGVYAAIMPKNNVALTVTFRETVKTAQLTFDIGSNGSVKVNDQECTNETALTLTAGDEISIGVTPDEGYEIDTVKLGDTPLTVSAAGTVAVAMPETDTLLTVTFKAKTSQPVISGDSSYNYFKMEDEKPTAYVYGKLNDFYAPSMNAQYGMKLWVKGEEDKVIPLPAMVNETTPAIAAPGQAFAIKVYGDAITADKEYVFQPYVGDENVGEQQTVSFTEG
ncbi:MAG: hypothetical protein SO147_00625 [Clostridia bacterium]|nr:hypothetical protein [Clostridia bacterium]